MWCAKRCFTITPPSVHDGRTRGRLCGTGHVLCSLKGVTSVGIWLVELRKSTMEILGLDAAGLKKMTSEVEKELGLHEDLMNLPGS